MHQPLASVTSRHHSFGDKMANREKTEGFEDDIDGPIDCSHHLYIAEEYMILAHDLSLLQWYDF